MSSIYSKLMEIQSELKAPKEHTNTFSNFQYRSCDDILESVKPLLKKNNTTVFISDSIEIISERYYVKATVHFVDIESGEEITVTGYAREDLNKKGMDVSQLTGACSSYARKYALSGMFCIDNSKDCDELELNDNTLNKNMKVSRNDIEVYCNIARDKGIGKEDAISIALRYYKLNNIESLTKDQCYKLARNIKKKPDVVIAWYKRGNKNKEEGGASSEQAS